MNYAFNSQCESGDAAWHSRGRCQRVVIVVLGVLCAIVTGEPIRAVPLQAQAGASSVVAPAAVDEQVFLRFNEWTKAYLAAETPEAKAILEPRGVELAKARREVMFQFIVFDPQRAFEYAVSMRARQRLPALVVNELEKRLSGRSEFEVTATLHRDPKTGKTKTRIQRSVVLDGQAYHASVYGQRLGTTSKKRIAWHGIALKNYIALLDTPMRRVEPGEALAANIIVGNKKQCPACGRDAALQGEAAQGLSVDIGGVIYFFDSEEHIKQVETAIQKQEAIIGPDVNGLELLETAKG